MRASDVIGPRIRDLRQRRGLTRDELAKKCVDLGADISAAVLVNIETGRPDKTTGKRRRDITVDELLILALALDVPPARLLIPFDQAGDDRTWLQITETHDISSWGALFWLAGESERYLPSDNDEGSVSPERRRAWREANVPIALYRTWLRQFDEVARHAYDGGDKYDAALAALAGTLNALSMNGFSPPPTPDDWVADMAREMLLEYEVPVQPKEKTDG